MSAVLSPAALAQCHPENLLDTKQIWEGGNAGRKGLMVWLFTSGEDGIVVEWTVRKEVKCCGIISFILVTLLNLDFPP